MVCGRALSRLPLAASVTTEVIINSIYKIMYVQNRKSGGEEETESNYYTRIQGYKNIFPRHFSTKRLVTGAAGL